MKLKEGASIVSMTVLSPELARQVAVAQAAAKAAQNADSGSSDDKEQAEQEQQEHAETSSSRQTGPWLLMITRAGHGKLVPVTDIPSRRSRGSTGVTGIRLAAGDKLAPAQLVLSKGDDVVLASKQGVMMRCSAADIRVLGRAAKGVRVISLNEGDEVRTVAVVPAEHKTALA